MFNRKIMAAALAVCAAFPCFAQDLAPATPNPGADTVTLDQVVDNVTQRERAYLAEVRKYSPVVETYIQNMKADPDVGAAPYNDQYFLGRLEMTPAAMKDRSYLKQAGVLRRMLDTLTSVYQIHYVPLGFMEMIVLDPQGFDRAHYDFQFVRREFLGDVRCLVLDVHPKSEKDVRFSGRIWVEDQGYNIVRFNGSYGPNPHLGHYLHFDSWRLNVQPGVWLPAYVYSEESDMPYGLGITRKLRFKAQTRLWGYDRSLGNHSSELSSILVDSPKVQDHSAAAQDASPIEAERDWQRMAEDNVLERLQKAGLVAPEGEVDKVLEQVITNLVVTNKLNIEPEVRARVLLTDPLESFTVGHTIVISRGLIDTLPDEASLAAVLADELAHIVLGHNIDTKYAFSDRMIFPDEKVFDRIHMRDNKRDEEAADTKALALLRNSPYADKLANAGLFLEALHARQKDLPHLLSAHIGNPMAYDGHLRMNALMQGAPQLQKRNLDQIAALPLGGRIHVNIWNDRIELEKSARVQLVSASEKMPFEVTPVYPYVSRFMTDDAKQKVASADGGK